MSFGGVSIEHAWCVDTDSEVAELTLPSDLVATEGVCEPACEWRYRGVCFDDPPDVPAVRVDVAQVAVHLCQNPRSPMHGVPHWRGVAAAGLMLLDGEARASPVVVWTFAMLHDCLRESDGEDRAHGARAAQLLERLGVSLPADELRLLRRALAEHEAGTRTREPTIGVCWDADRLNLWRLGIRPDPRRLSTRTARDPATIERVRELHANPPSLLRLCEAYAVRARTFRGESIPVPTGAGKPPPGSRFHLDSDGLALVYHGTAGSAARMIRRRGLAACENEWLPGHGRIYVSGSFAYAAAHAVARTRWLDHLELGQPASAAKCAVFAVRIDPDELRIDPEGDAGYYTTQPIPPAALRDHWRLALSQAEQAVTTCPDDDAVRHSFRRMGQRA